jgi:hypothetical protein
MSYPPQTIILEPVQTAVCQPRAGGAFAVVTAVQASAEASYWPPSFKGPPPFPPQTIILALVQTAVWKPRADGAPAVVVAVHVLATGSYCPPSL